ncbi:MAG TPA: M17 family peptidase N-terminal domain-containing protein, partial [Cellvibrionaceae bacterium]
MQFQVKNVDALLASSQCLVIGIFEGQQHTSAAEQLDKAGAKALSHLLHADGFKANAGQTLLLHHSVGQKAQRLLLVGLGKATSKGITEQNFGKAITALATTLKTLNSRDALIDFNGIEVDCRDASWQVQHTVQTLLTELWQFDQLKSKKTTAPSVKKITLNGNRKNAAQLKKGLALGQALGDGINYARELGNLPGNICTPSYLAKQARGLARGEKTLSVSVLGEKQMKMLGMGSLLSVSAGSAEDAQLIVMEYKGAAKSRKPTALVGKGITFDTGGISIKPPPGMDEMKFDMCGAASVFGTMKTLLALKPAINVVAIVAAAENMPSGTATKPGDIVTSMSGQTIEVL